MNQLPATRMLVLLVITATQLVVSEGSNEFIGFDCANTNVNVSTISRSDVADCQSPKSKINTTEAQVVLVQLSPIKRHLVKQCKVTILRHILFCGQGHHAAGVEHGLTTFVMPMTRDGCMNAHLYGTISIYGKTIVDLRVNGTVHVNTFLAGSYDKNAHCVVDSYTDIYGTYRDVVVQADIDITLSEYYAETNTQSNVIKLLSGREYKLQSLKCLDVDEGYTFWDPVIIKTCDLQKYEKIYEGSATKMSINKDEIFYTVNLQTISFTLSAIGQDTICYVNVIRTEHPKLFILETSTSVNPFRDVQTISEANIDLFQYVNSKLVHVEQHVRFQVNEMYEKLIMKRCELERQVLKTTLAMAALNADEFALQYYNAPGHAAVVSGEVIHLIECTPVSLKIRQTERCYDKIPVVNRRNDSLFLSPVTRILSTQAAEIECTKISAPRFLIRGSWYVFTPQARQVPAPIVLTPSNKMDWEYKSLKHLMTSGIYTLDDLEKFSKYITEVQQKPSIVTQVTRYFSGHYNNIMDEGYSVNKVIENINITAQMQNIWNSIKDKLTALGNTFSLLLGCFVIIKIIKSVMSTMITNCNSAGAVQAFIVRLFLAVMKACASAGNARGTDEGQSPTHQRQRCEDFRHPTIIQIDQPYPKPMAN